MINNELNRKDIVNIINANELMKVKLILPMLLMGCNVSQSVETKPTITTKNKLEIYTLESVYVQHSNKKLNSGSRAELNKFKATYDYFAAFAVNPNEKGSSAWVGGNDLKTPSKHALDICKLGSKSPQNCIVYATIVPKGYDTKKEGVTLGHEPTRIFNKEVLGTLRANEYAAVAVSQATGVGFGISTVKDKAINLSIGACQREVAAVKSKAPKIWREYWNAKHYKCNVVYVRAPN